MTLSSQKSSPSPGLRFVGSPNQYRGLTGPYRAFSLSRTTRATESPKIFSPMTSLYIDFPTRRIRQNRSVLGSAVSPCTDVIVFKRPPFFFFFCFFFPGSMLNRCWCRLETRRGWFTGLRLLTTGEARDCLRSGRSSHESPKKRQQKTTTGI